MPASAVGQRARSNPVPNLGPNPVPKETPFVKRETATLRAWPALRPLLEVHGPMAVVDLETTGLPDRRSSHIIEFAAVLVDPDRESVETVSTLIRPRSSLSPAIRRLTGLSDAVLDAAPRLDEVASSLAECLQGRAIIAHNAPFERHFLAKEIDRRLERARYLDTQELLGLTHPDAKDQRLESFSQMLLGRPERHRALSDALDTLEIVVAVADGAAASEPRYVHARRALDRFAPESDWRPLLGSGLGSPDEHESSPFVAIGETAEAPVPFDEDAIAAVLADEARGRRAFPGYRVRHEQIELARAFARNLARGETLLLEGGTGVGKSLAYLAAAIPFAMDDSRRQAQAARHRLHAHEAASGSAAREGHRVGGPLPRPPGAARASRSRAAPTTSASVAWPMRWPKVAIPSSSWKSG